MQFLPTILAIAATASAAALSVEKRADVCSGLDSPQCCETSVDGLLVLTCADPPGSPSTDAELVDACSSTGTTAQCCLLPVAGDAVGCTEVAA